MQKFKVVFVNSGMPRKKKGVGSPPSPCLASPSRGPLLCLVCNKPSATNVSIQCCDCSQPTHVRCMQLSVRLVNKLKAAGNWQCAACKSCQVCHGRGSEKDLLFCDKCDRGLHTTCANPPLRSIPPGAFVCDICRNTSGKDRIAKKRQRSIDVDTTVSKKIATCTTQECRFHPVKSDQLLFRAAELAAASQLHHPLTIDLSAFGERKLDWVTFGKYRISPQYHSPFPQEYAHLPELFFCEFCLDYLTCIESLQRHLAKCNWHHPPGVEIYRLGNTSFFEVDGHKEPVYCQNLCLLSKLFLHHKTLYFDVQPFLFYVMIEWDEHGGHVLGYFSKEKVSDMDYNVSCILTLPQHQRKGYGRMLIDFSYLLTKRERKTGTPEKPLSDLGLLTYRRYWKDVLLENLVKIEPEKDNEKIVSVRGLSLETGITSNDIVGTLQAYGMIKYWRGTHVIVLSEEAVDSTTKHMLTKKKYIDGKYLVWEPVSRNE